MNNKESKVSSRFFGTPNTHQQSPQSGSQSVSGITCRKKATIKLSGAKFQTVEDVKAGGDADLELKGVKNAVQQVRKVGAEDVKLVLDQAKNVQKSNATQSVSTALNTSSTATSLSNSENMDESEGQQRNNYGH